MGILFPANRKQLIEQHIASMETFAVALHNRFLPFVSRRKLIERLETCTTQMRRVHDSICEREAKLDK